MTSNASRDSTLSSHSAFTTGDARDRSAAFRGASHAFSRAPTASKTSPVGHNRTNAALTAASAVGRGRKREEKPPNGTFSGTLQTSRPSVTKPQTSTASNVQRNTRQISQSRQQSPSHAAALLAATSTVSPTPEKSPSPTSIRGSRQSSPLHSVDDLRPSDSIDDPASSDIHSLVNLFESKQRPQTTTPVVQSVRYVNKPTLSIANPRSITPETRSVSSVTISPRSVLNAGFHSNEDAKKPIQSSTPGVAAAASAKSTGLRRTSTDSVKPLISSLHNGPEFLALPKLETPTSLDGAEDTDGSSTTTVRHSRSPNISAVDPTETFLNEAAVNLQSRLRRSPARPALPSRRTEPVVLPLAQSPKAMQRPALAPHQNTTSLLDPVRPSRRPTRASDSYVSQLSVDSLANAMVASSLASSRAPSPSKPPPLPPPRRHGKHSLFRHHGSQEASRTPSPAKGMRQTMREPLKSDDEEGIRKHRTHRVKHPNKHNEGDRKRYRTQLTERERKRYEGVWAANKGILLNADSPNAVINIVVRDIWKRSRLPDDVLEEVWDLVDTQGIGKLERDEFVVGMFFIDQRLKGNKLPVKVSDSIWSSVRHLSGINISRDRR